MAPDAHAKAARTAAAMREATAGLPGIEEKRMFGGLCWMLDGHMLCCACGPRQDGAALFRVGKAAQAEAMAQPGAGPMTMTGRAMGGMVQLSAEVAADPALRAPLMALALAHARSLPPK